MASSQAILIEYASGQCAAIAFAHMEEVLDAPALIHVPLAPSHCDTLVEWHGDWIPMFDLGIWCGSQEQNAKRFCVVVSYRQNRDTPRLYGSLRSVSFPRIVEIDDSAAAPLPDPRWNGFARACFRDGDQVVPVPDLPALFETPDRQAAPVAGGDISIESLEENLA
ncbi:MAG: chemotaxis protein CheW [Betaproteobacteria bacterium]|nr:chemotaxis protein CheW [Betaproteobacteria bacterium]